MSERTPDPLADEVRNAVRAGDERTALTRALEGYGPEILGFLVAMLRDADAADDAFSVFCEDVWRGLSGVRSDTSLRAWMYTLARHAAARHSRARYERQRKPLSWAPLDALEARVRTETSRYLQTQARSAVDRLREQLEPDERALLILRLDRKLAWNEIVDVMAAPDSQRSAEQLRRDAAILRKRFERLKTRLRQLAAEAGLLDE